MAVSKRTRYEVLRRDNHACRYCGRSAPKVRLTVDHVTPVALGGGDDPSNLVAACADCNAGKSSSSPDASLVADVAQKAVEWAAAVSRFNDERMADRKKRDAYVRRFEKAWDRWLYGSPEDRKRLPKPSDWKATLWQFYASGLPIGELEDAVEIAASNQMVHVDNAFRYMCGVVRNKVAEIQEGARAALDAANEDTLPEGGDRDFRIYTQGWWDGYQAHASGLRLSDPLSIVVDQLGRPDAVEVNEQFGLIYASGCGAGELFDRRMEVIGGA